MRMCMKLSFPNSSARNSGQDLIIGFQGEQPFQIVVYKFGAGGFIRPGKRDNRNAEGQVHFTEDSLLQSKKFYKRLIDPFWR